MNASTISYYKEAKRVFDIEINALKSVLVQLEDSFDVAVGLMRACEGKVVDANDYLSGALRMHDIVSK
jgi:hypothetical protein